jgi:hypothetical protein
VFIFAQYACPREATIVRVSPMAELGGVFHRPTLECIGPAHCELRNQSNRFSPIPSLTVGRFTKQSGARQTC